MHTFAYFKEKDIITTFYGLKPLTRYYFYFDNKQVTTKVKQFGKKLNQPLISDENGQLKTVFYVSSNITSKSIQSLKYKVTDLKAGNKEITLTTLDVSVLPENFRDSSLSYSSITLGLEKNI